MIDFIRVVACFDTLFLFMAESYFMVQMYHVWWSHLDDIQISPWKSLAIRKAQNPDTPTSVARIKSADKRKGHGNSSAVLMGTENGAFPLKCNLNPAILQTGLHAVTSKQCSHSNVLTIIKDRNSRICTSLKCYVGLVLTCKSSIHSEFIFVMCCEVRACSFVWHCSIVPEQIVEDSFPSTEWSRRSCWKQLTT